MKLDDLTGKKFGMLTVIKRMDNSKNGKPRWLCKCDCGNEKIIYSENLKKDNCIKNCGCLQKQEIHKRRFIDITGRKFGRLIVLCFAYKKSNRYYWLCKCDCGNEVTVSKGNLTNGNCRSCGCLSSELTSERNKRYNTYDLTGKHGIGYTTNVEEFYFDLEDYDLIKGYCWHIDSMGYVNTNFPERVRMHQLLLKSSEHPLMVVDHINRNRNDNRKENLRICEQRNNSRNRNITDKNKSGYIGVYEAPDGKWVAQIKIESKTMYLGRYKEKEEALIKRLQAELLYYGEFAPQKNLFNEYNISLDTNIVINNKESIRGVSYIKHKNRWFAYIQINRIKHRLGYYKTKDEAIVARLKVEKQFLGDTAPQKYLFEKYNI